ncbi:hypothetical protein Pcinc_026759 [Petrolisthes cinctipes]|uniref:Uncharacterized protein n=1 Tax=Petrolisthes cinctipes TaxID=88211 RepID=A0AAE1F697_PETCI|nr:hypothetical protein Pcinc_026759 [Petrolisthes cinctipes]
MLSNAEGGRCCRVDGLQLECEVIVVGTPLSPTHLYYTTCQPSSLSRLTLPTRPTPHILHPSPQPHISYLTSQSPTSHPIFYTPVHNLTLHISHLQFTTSQLTFYTPVHNLTPHILHPSPQPYTSYFTPQSPTSHPIFCISFLRHISYTSAPRPILLTYHISVSHPIA